MIANILASHIIEFVAMDQTGFGINHSLYVNIQKFLKSPKCLF